QVPAQRDALVQLRELGIEQQLAQLRLADEDDAQQLARGRLQVEEQADLLQQLDGEGLRLVEDDHARAAGLALRDQVRVERVEQIGLALTGRREPELAADAAQQIERREGRGERVRGGDVWTQLGEERPQQRGLAGADLAGDADEAARFGEPQPQV